jgi:hypothetical protein
MQAKHTVGDPIHCILYFGDDRASLKFYGEVTAVRRLKGVIFPDQVHCDVSLEQAEGPNIEITNLPQAVVLAGGAILAEEESV